MRNDVSCLSLEILGGAFSLSKWFQHRSAHAVLPNASSEPGKSKSVSHEAMVAIKKIACLGKDVPWYGSRTGYYARLPEALRKLGIDLKVVVPRAGLVARGVGKLFALLRSLPARNQAHTLAEIEFDLARKWHRPHASLILSAEDHLSYAEFLVTRCGHVPREIVAVIHHPYELWSVEDLNQLSRFQSALVLYSSDVCQFERHLGKGRLRAVPHGVDVAFFRPAQDNQARSPTRLLFVGQFGRDYQVLVETINMLSELRPCLEFHVLTGPWGDANPAWDMLRSSAKVVRHRDLDDVRLRELYQVSAVMLQPLEFCGANNAVVESLACGLPIIASDVGGIRDYGGGKIFPVVGKKDVRAMVAEVTRLLDSPNERKTISLRSREFAEKRLSWEASASAHLEAISALAKK